MKSKFVTLALVATVAACSGDPFVEEDTNTTPDTGAQIDSDRTLPPGTASPQPNASIFRSEPNQAAGGLQGDGSVSAVSYDSANDEFTVDGLAFDGDNVYTRGTAVSSLNEYAVYEAPTLFTDPQNNVPINQFTHRAIYGVSQSGNTEFAIVRTGAFIDFGFGGFIYQRNGDVTLPTSGQAAYTGNVAAVRDFNTRGGLEYATADIAIDIDFEDFDDSGRILGDGVRGRVTNRTIFDINGNDITSQVVSTFNADNDASLTSIPELRFRVGPNVLDENGEVTGEIFSTYVDNEGAIQSFEDGNYYAIVSGENADEIVGIYVVQSTPAENVEARETGGFIVYR